MSQTWLELPPKREWSREMLYAFQERLAICLTEGVPEDRAEALALEAVQGWE
jgi:hypothetical protein